MARYHFIIGWSIALVVSSCAQIGSLSGGDKDQFAPLPVHAKGDTPDKSVNYKAQEISITFDEYFKLDNPSENIVIVPPHAKLNTRVAKKTLHVYWEDTLQPNTTYSIYLNNAVADITEGNDSIMQFVFSTGSILDSLSYTTFVSDARSSEARAGVTVTLYDTSRMELISVGKTDNTGRVKLSNLRAGTYVLDAFEDKNKNLQPDDDEMVGFHKEPWLILDSSTTDSLSIRLFTPLKKPQISNVRFIQPSSFAVSATRSLSEVQITINGKEIGMDRIRNLSEDSLLFWPADSIASYNEIVVKTPEFTDTAVFKLKRNTSGTIQILPRAFLKVAPSDSVSLTLNDLIVKADLNKIDLLNKSDSSRIEVTTRVYKNSLLILFDRGDGGEFLLRLADSAIHCEHGFTTLTQLSVSALPDRKYGSINLDLTAYQIPVIATPILNGQPIKDLFVSDPSSPVIIKELEPGEYTFVVVRDLNGNGKWDTGDPELRTQPEPVDHYSQKTKVRANWEISVPLKPSDP